ncbi:MAG: 3-hydroxyacyl-CoA dehydrogenase NAD-binding domain-containing protein [Alphaproteobacteria bacterium]
MNLTQMSFDKDVNGIVTITWDMPGRTMNVLSQESMADFRTCIEAITADDTVTGVIITSGKPAFLAGADLGELGGSSGGGAEDEMAALRAAFDNAYAFNKLLRELETCGKPVVAAINGTALGGGLEICLACHYRVVADGAGIQLGLPESKVGLLPGGGGTQRLPRLIGAGNALPLILQGTSLNPEKALAQGIVHKVVPADQLLAEARRWIKEEGDPVQPWDKKGYKVPGGNPYENATTFVIGNAMLRKQTHMNYPAQANIMKCVYEGLLVPIEAGLRIESRYFVDLLRRPESKNMIRSLFLSMQELNKLARRPEDVPTYDVKKLGMLGAGMMGAGIAYVSALAGMEVILIDQSQEGAEKGKQYAVDLLDKQIKRGRMTEAMKRDILARIVPTTDYDLLKGADLIIEAVFEDRTIKADVTKRAEAMIAEDAVFGSNTSTLPITGLAEASVRPKNFIGIHFFSPVDKMPLVEIIMGKETSPQTLAKAMDYVKKIRKTPIVVNDSRGFYTSRVFGTYVGEGIQMLAEGVTPALIENAGRMTGMPVPPLMLNDEVSLELGYKVRQQTKKDLGDAYKETPIDKLVEDLVIKHGRLGKKASKGFYDYPSEGPKRLWPGLSDLVQTKDEQPDVNELRLRFMVIQALETARCFEENVLTDVRDADVGAILGWGFAPYTGGPLSFIDTMGVREFVATCERLAQLYGERFMPNTLLREMAEAGDTFYGRFNPQNADKAA